MEYNIVDNVCSMILKRLDEKKEIRDEQISLFLKESLSIISSAETLDLPRSFYLLKENVYKCWMYDRIDEYNISQAFVYGNLWSSFKLIELEEQRKKNRKSINTIASQYVNYVKIFQAIKNEPGIKHKDLAESSDKTASELSQFFAKIRDQQFVSYIRTGREKYYYLEERGIDLLNKMEEQKKRDFESSIWKKIKDVEKCNNNVWNTNKFIYVALDEKYKFETKRRQYSNKNRNEYIEKFRDDIYMFLSQYDGKTVYSQMQNQDNVVISHYFLDEESGEKIFEASIKKVDESNIDKEIDIEKFVSSDFKVLDFALSIGGRC